MKPPRISAVVRDLAKTIPGPRFESPMQCVNCAAQWVAVYARPRLKFPCPYCGRRSGERVCFAEVPYRAIN